MKLEEFLFSADASIIKCVISNLFSHLVDCFRFLVKSQLILVTLSLSTFYFIACALDVIPKKSLRDLRS
jgi:hypothetical protein